MARRFLPVIDVEVEGQAAKALVDTGCMTSVVSAGLVGACKGENYLVAFNNARVRCQGYRRTRVKVDETELWLDAIVADNVLDGVSLVLGMDAIEQMGGVHVHNGEVGFGGRCRERTEKREERNRDVNMVGIDDDKVSSVVEESAVEVIEDPDFRAIFDGKIWTVEWKWKAELPRLTNEVECYDRHMDSEVRAGFEKELDEWIEKGILVPWKEPVKKGVIPLMAVVQPTKNKIRPVLDFRELNPFVSCHTGDDVVDVCGEALREWRQEVGAKTILDLKSAYLQLRVKEDLWEFQLVNHKGRTFCLTRLGFGLTSAPRIMAKILKHVLSKEGDIESATKSYIDDILVNDEKIAVNRVEQHLLQYGLESKRPIPLDGGAALGLQLEEDENGQLVFSRGNEIPRVGSGVTKKELYSICGKLVGHYPIAGWLRVACSFVKRMASGVDWKDEVDGKVHAMLEEVVQRTRRDDPVKGYWNVRAAKNGTVWCDASSIAMGVVLMVDGKTVEDAAWLRKKTDYSHINVAELEAVLKGVNLAIKWGLSEVEIVTDSVTVHGWITTLLSEERRVHTKGASELLVKRRLGILKGLMSELNVRISVTLVRSAKNKADELTRVKKEWMVVQPCESGGGEAEVCAVTHSDLKSLHEMHHMGVDRSLFVSRKKFPEARRDDVRKVVQSCERCQSIDPAPVTHERGNLSVYENWTRLSIDVTHYHQVPYLSIVDCGPGRFAIWRELKRETASCIMNIMNEIFLERGAVKEVLLDNASVFHSDMFSQFLQGWSVRPVFRAAFRPEGNGIVERHHRTVKALAERAHVSPLEAVYWYNSTPRRGVDPETVPQRAIFTYTWRGPVSTEEEEEVQDTDGRQSHLQARFRIGDNVWVKPPNNRCTTQWKKGVVTGVNSENNIDVDGMARHVLDVRRVVELNEEERVEESDNEENEDGDRSAEVEVEDPGLERPRRERRPPAWLQDYVQE